MRVRKAFQTGSLIVLVTTVVGCGGTTLPGEESLLPLQPGATKGEVLDALPDGGIRPTSSMEEPQLMAGYWMDRYFIEGGYVEVLWVHDVEVGYPSEAFRRNLNPVIFRDEMLDGWGWDHFDARSEEWSITERRPTSVDAANTPTHFPPEVEPRGEPEPELPDTRPEAGSEDESARPVDIAA